MEQHPPQTNGIYQIPRAEEEDHSVMLSVDNNNININGNNGDNGNNLNGNNRNVNGSNGNNVNGNDLNHNHVLHNLPVELMDSAARERHRLITAHAVSLKETIASSCAIIARETQIVIEMIHLHLRELRRQQQQEKPTREELRQQTAMYDLLTEHMRTKNEYTLRAMAEMKESWELEDYLKGFDRRYGYAAGGENNEEEDDVEGEDEEGPEEGVEGGNGDENNLQQQERGVNGGGMGGRARGLGSHPSISSVITISSLTTNEGHRNGYINGTTEASSITEVTPLSNGGAIAMNGNTGNRIPFPHPNGGESRMQFH